jgi:hypothetical protein
METYKKKKSIFFIMLSRDLIKEILLDHRKEILQKPLGVIRDICDNIEAKISMPHIIFITGMRRTGKSTLLRQIIEKWYRDGSFYYLNFEDERFFHFDASEFNEIYEVLVELYGSQKTFLLDEIQNIPRFESFVRRFYDNGFKFFITGSNANLLQSDFATKLTGRYLSILVKPFSFIEFLDFQKIAHEQIHQLQTESRAQIKKAFDDYLIHGGMPEYIQYRENEILFRIYQDILYRDIITRHGSVDLINLRELSQYLISNVSKNFSYNHLKSMCRIKSVTTIKNYLDYLEETLFCSISRKYDPSVRIQISQEKKFYLTDNGFIRRISTSGTRDVTYVFENLIFTTLWGNGVIFFHRDKFECDFVRIQNNSITDLYQVCYNITKNNKEREINGLVEAAKRFNLSEGWLITYDQEEVSITEEVTIHIVPAWKWMLNVVQRKNI